MGGAARLRDRRRRGRDFLERVFHKLLLNFTWWVNRKDAEGNNLFEGGFLGLDNIGPFDRSALPVSGTLEQSDGTAWMAMYCQNLLEIALLLAEHDPTYEDLATKFFEHFALIASALNDKGLWDEEDGFYYDVLHTGDGGVVPLRARSIVGLLPLAAVTTLGPETMARLPDFTARVDVVHGQPAGGAVSRAAHGLGRARRLADALDRRRGRGCGGSSAPMLDPDEFLSDHGLRALSKFHEANPLQVSIDGVDGDARLRAGRVDERPLRRQLELARPDLVPDQLPARRDAPRLPPLPRRRLQGRVPDRLGPRAVARAGRRRARRRG